MCALPISALYPLFQRKSWKRRFFLLDDFTICYFKCEQVCSHSGTRTIGGTREASSAQKPPPGSGPSAPGLTAGARPARACRARRARRARQARRAAPPAAEVGSTSRPAPPRPARGRWPTGRGAAGAQGDAAATRAARTPGGGTRVGRASTRGAGPRGRDHALQLRAAPGALPTEIGRASCRERVSSPV